MSNKPTLSLRDSAEQARSTSDNRTEVSAVKRPERVPVDGRRDVLTVSNKDPGFVYRWVNDIEDSIARYMRGGYEQVTHSVKIGESEQAGGGDSSPVSKYVGGGITAILMRIKREWYDEDQRLRDEHTDASEADMFRALNDGRDGKYGEVKRSVPRPR